jgi:hypothetical protein
MSAWAYAAVNDFGSARSMMEHAAEAAASVGDVERSANSYVDAAIIALAGNREDRLDGLLKKTRSLLGSPVLPEPARNIILRRIGEEPRLAQVWVAP